MTSTRELRVSRPDDDRENRALHGLTRSLINNMVQGVQKPFEKRLEIVGVGYQASLSGKDLSLQVGFANTVKLPIPEMVTCEVPAPTTIIVQERRQACGRAVRGQHPGASVLRNPTRARACGYQGE